MKYRPLILCGALSPLIYILASVVGGWLLPEYSHIKHSVSDLLADGAPNKALLDTMMFISNLLTLIGAAAVIVLYKKIFSRNVLIGFFLLLLTGLSNILSAYVFRLPFESEMTLSGIIHIGLVVNVVLLTIAAILMLGFNMVKYPGWAWFKKYSIFTFIIFLLLGLISPVIINLNLPIIGLVERLAVGIYAQWVVVLFIKIYRMDTLNPL